MNKQSNVLNVQSVNILTWRSEVAIERTSRVRTGEIWYLSPVLKKLIVLA